MCVVFISCYKNLDIVWVVWIMGDIKMLVDFVVVINDLLVVVDFLNIVN